MTLSTADTLEFLQAVGAAFPDDAPRAAPILYEEANSLRRRSPPVIVTPPHSRNSADFREPGRRLRVDLARAGQPIPLSPRQVPVKAPRLTAGLSYTAELS
jgi:hypothetical protein